MLEIGREEPGNGSVVEGEFLEVLETREVVIARCWVDDFIPTREKTGGSERCRNFVTDESEKVAVARSTEGLTDMQIGKRRELVDEIGCRVVPGFRIGSVCQNEFQRFELRETGRRNCRRMWVRLGSFEGGGM